MCIKVDWLIPKIETWVIDKKWVLNILVKGKFCSETKSYKII